MSKKRRYKELRDKRANPDELPRSSLSKNGDVPVRLAVSKEIPTQGSDLVSLERAKAAKSIALATFRAVADVVGVGITRVNGDYGVKINLKEAPAPDVSLPASIDGVPIRVEVTGAIRPR